MYASFVFLFSEECGSKYTGKQEHQSLPHIGKHEAKHHQISKNHEKRRINCPVCRHGVSSHEHLKGSEKTGIAKLNRRSGKGSVA